MNSFEYSVDRSEGESILSLCNSNKNDYYKVKYEELDDIFTKASNVDAINGINEVFVTLMKHNQCDLIYLKKMIELGADPHYQNDTPFLISKTAELISYFIEHHNVDVNVQSQSILLNWSSDFIVLKILLEAGLQITSTSLNYIVSKSSGSMIKLLIDHGIDIEQILIAVNARRYQFPEDLGSCLIDEIAKYTSIINHDVMNKFLCTIYSSHGLTIDQFLILINAGANPNKCDDYLFSNICRYYDKDIVLYLLTHCNVNINAYDSAALENAIHSRSLEICEILLESGIVVTNRCIKKSIGEKKYLNMLLNHGVAVERITRIFLDNLDVLYGKQLILSGANFNDYFLC